MTTETTNNDRVSLSARPGFTPLPSDPALLTTDHARAVFGGDVAGVLRDIARAIMLNGTVGDRRGGTVGDRRGGTPGDAPDAGRGA